MENDSLFQADLFFRIQLDFPKGHFGSVAAGSVFDEYFDSCRIIRRIGDQQAILLPEGIDMVEIPGFPAVPERIYPGQFQMNRQFTSSFVKYATAFSASSIPRSNPFSLMHSRSAMSHSDASSLIFPEISALYLSESSLEKISGSASMPIRR